jgi:hypothetical protein
MKFLITESGLGNLVHKVLSSNKRIMPDEATIKLIKSYLDSNPDVNLVDLIGIKMGSFDFKVFKAFSIPSLFIFIINIYYKYLFF